MEKLDKVLDGEYSRRKDAIHKCVEVGYKRGYDIIALQHGGWCAGSRDAEKTYKKYGSSHDCKKDGEGGPWANQVYRINIHDELWVLYSCNSFVILHVTYLQSIMLRHR